MLIVRRAKLYYTVSGIITPICGCPVHRSVHGSVHGTDTYPLRCNDASWRNATSVGSVISSEFTTLLMGSMCSLCNRTRL